MPDTAKTWQLIHDERKTLVETLASLTQEQWQTPSLCTGWTVQQTAAHILIGAEQTTSSFSKGMLTNGFRFNTMMDRGAHRLGTLPPREIVQRLRVTTTTTNHPPAPVVTMLGEVVVHGEDIRRPLGLPDETAADATVACLEMYKNASFPTGTKKRISGLRLVATDVGWSHGEGPEVSGTGMSLLLAMCGRAVDPAALSGPGAAPLRGRLTSQAG